MKQAVKIMGNRIRQARENAGLSQAELARKLQYKAASSVARAESGEVDLPQSKIAAFASALNVPVGFLLGDAMKGNLPAETSRNVSTDAARIAAVLRKLQANVNAAFDAAIADVLNGNL